MAQQRMVALLKGASRRWAGSSAAERTTLLPTLYNLSRAYSSKLFVGGLAYHTTEEMLRKAFAEHGEVVDVRIITDRETGKSRGFGFITFSSDADAETAKAKMSNHLLDGRFLRVDLASARPAQPPASPRPFGTPSSSSSSGFSFGAEGTRPPVVEDWGPLPFHAVNSTQTTVSEGGSDSTTGTLFQGYADASIGGYSSTHSTFSMGTSSSVTSTQQTYSNATIASQSCSSISKVRSSSFDTVACSTAASISARQTEPVNNGMAAAPNVSSSEATQGMAAKSSTMASVSSFGAGAGQSFTNRSYSEAGAGSPKTANFKQDNNFKIGRTGFGSGGGRPPSVLDLGNATYDFRNFPEFDSKAYKDFKAPGELDEPKKRVLFQTNKLAPKRAETWEKKLTEEAIPPAMGPLFDFGLSGFPDSPPPSNAENKPHGGFSLNVNLDELPEAEPVRLPYSIFTARTLPPLDLPWLTPEADNWSEIGKPPRRIEDSPYSPFSPDLKDDPEFWWDPYDFDPEARMLKAEETVEANTTKETEGEFKVSKEPEAEARLCKAAEAEEVPVDNVAAS